MLVSPFITNAPANRAARNFVGERRYASSAARSSGSHAAEMTCRWARWPKRYGKKRRPEAAGDHARQDARAVRRQREAQEHGDVVDRQGSKTHRVKRQTKQRDPDEVLAVRERKFRRIEDRRVEQMQRRVR